jgi:adenosine deaminase
VEQPKTLADEDFLRRLPKTDLHCHFMGAIPADTAWAVARRNGAALPKGVTGPQDLYRFEDFYQFLDLYTALATALRTEEDFAEAAYASLAESVRNGNLRYREMAFNPTDHRKADVPYQAQLAGLRDGIRRAEDEFGVRCRLIPSINRMESPDLAVEMVREVIQDREARDTGAARAGGGDLVVGIGLDAAERSGPPELFAEAFRIAGEAGLRRTAHACEDNQTLAEGPPRNAVTCVDVLGCERIDHGYNLLADPILLARFRDQALPFTVCSHTANRQLTTRRRRNVRAMLDAGLRCVFATDDPTMFGTDPGETYAVLGDFLRLDRDAAIAQALAGVDASWLPEPERSALREEFESDISRLTAA